MVNPSSKDKRAAKRNAAALRDTLAEERPTKQNWEVCNDAAGSASPGTGHWLPTCTATCSSSRAHELTAVSGAATLTVPSPALHIRTGHCRRVKKGKGKGRKGGRRHELDADGSWLGRRWV